MSDGADSLLSRREQLTDLVEHVLAQAKAKGATAAEVSAGLSTGLSVTVRMGEVETLEHHRDRGLGITVYFGQRKGNASTSDFAPASIQESVEAACSIARHTEPDPAAGLADADRMAVDPPELDLYHPWDLSAEQAVELARDSERAALEVDSRITNSEGASVHAGAGLSVYGNSHGFVGVKQGTRHSIGCSVIASDGQGMQRDHWYSVARHADALDTPEAVGQLAGSRAVRRLGCRPIRTGQFRVLYAPEVARGLIGHFVSAVSGGSLYRRASFLLDQKGQPVFPAGFRIDEQPHLHGALGSAAFDGEGVATAPRDLISDGVLQGYVLDSYSARRLNMETTGNAGGVHNLVVEPGTQDQTSLLQSMGTGLWVTELMGQGINMVTGDYSRGAAGYWVENGEVVHPVEEITVAGNLRDMFRQILAVGNDVDLRGNIRCGSLLVDGLTIASGTQ
ncbi:MAG: metalloprotease PmbA [Pseudomonadota bacterium]|nr:metalloprotease PmbA [Pseudomonadota bacterium]